MTEQQKIENIASDIVSGIYGTTQKCGTEWQKWTYALLQANKIYKMVSTVGHRNVEQSGRSGHTH